jgi:hypothetical protein
MKNKVCGAMVAVVCGVAIVAAAQNTSSSASQTNSSSSTDKITVTGCVQRADQTATGTSGTVGATGDAGTRFILSNATRKAGAMSATGTSGTSTPNSATPNSAGSYRLDAEDSKISSHVGHKVEITGTLESASMSNSAASSGSAPAAGQPGANAPRLKVDSVNMVSMTCQ